MVRKIKIAGILDAGPGNWRTPFSYIAPFTFIVDTEGDELVFRVGDYLMAANPGGHVGVIDVAVTGLEPIGGIRRYWCGLGSSVSPVEGNVSAGDGDYLIVPPHTFAIWRLQ